MSTAARSSKFLRNHSCFLRSVFLLFFAFCTSYSRSQPIKVCFGETRDNYGVDENENGGRGSQGSQYDWSVNDSRFVGNILHNRTNVVDIDWGNTPEGNYILNVDESITGVINCVAIRQTMNITILQRSPQVSLPNNKYICVDPVTNALVNAVLLDTNLPVAQYSFVWKFEGTVLPDTGFSIMADKVGKYSVMVRNKATGCTSPALAEANIKASSAAIAVGKVDNTFMEVQDIAVIVSGGIGVYQYSIDGINFQDSPFFSVSEPGVYTVVIQDKNGCNNTYLTAAVIKYPKYFTPNGDGYNDIWKVDNFPASMKPKISIFDRYGKVLRIMNNIGESWDGYYDGEPVPSDDYWFVLEYINADGVPATFKSHFTLKR